MRIVDTDQGPTEIKAYSTAEEADVALGAHLAGHKDHPLVRGLGSLSEIGDQPPLVALSGAILAYGVLANNQRAARAGAHMLGSLVLATLIKTALKHIVARTRPNVLLEEGRYEAEALGPNEGAWHSFPSGHAAGSVAVARAVARVYPKARTVAYAGAAAVALIQVPRGAHYPTDVAAGALVGAVAEAVVNRAAAYLWLR